MSWFDKTHLQKHDEIVIDGLHGYILPHAGTTYTGNIISHTLRFKPKKQFTTVYILYYPSNETENVNVNGKRYFHEYYVIFKSLQFFFGKKNYIPINIRKKESIQDLTSFPNDSLLVLSVDFSHDIPLQKSLVLENCAAHSLLQKEYNENKQKCLEVVDDIKTFQKVTHILQNFTLQWVGRTKSPSSSNNNGVGYLSFLIRNNFNPLDNASNINGIFITAYDENMKQRECLGNWFSANPWSKEKENKLKNEVIDKGQTQSRLTSSQYDTTIPVTHYTITYLFKENTKQFIRGWHGIKQNAFYLPDVFL